MKQYTLNGAESMTYKHEHPERTAYKQYDGMNFDYCFQIWPNRKAMAKSIHMQQKREHRYNDWIAVQKLNDGEGY
jgi:hypothetical protein